MIEVEKCIICGKKVELQDQICARCADDIEFSNNMEG